MKHEFYGALACIVAVQSKATLLRVGSIAVKDSRILAEGYNGTIRGRSNVCEEVVDGEVVTKDEVIHAEANLIYKLSRDGISSRGATLYTTHSPCLKCATALVAAEFKAIYYIEPFKKYDGIVFASECGVEVHQLNKTSVMLNIQAAMGYISHKN